MAVPLNLTVRLHRLYCHDEGDGAGNAEPYIWPVFFKIDGDNFAYQQGSGLIGSPTVNSRNGNHDNMGSLSVDAGDTVYIPESLGSWSTTLKPIRINDPGIRTLLGKDNLPGIVGVVVTVMEEDGWSDNLAKEGYSAFVNAVHLAVVKVAADYQHALSLPTKEQIEAKITEIKAQASGSVRAQVKGSMDAWQLLWYGTFGDNDDLIGSEAFIGNSDEFSWAHPNDFSRRWNSDESEDGDWELFGYFAATVPEGTFGECSLDQLFGSMEMSDRDKEGGFSALREFRDTEFRSYAGLDTWWTSLRKATPELARLAQTDEEVKRALVMLLDQAPRALSDRSSTVEADALANARLVLERLAAASPMRASEFINQALRVVERAKGRSWDDALDLVSVTKPRGRKPRAGSRRFDVA